VLDDEMGVSTVLRNLDVFRTTAALILFVYSGCGWTVVNWNLICRLLTIAEVQHYACGHSL